SSTSMIFSPPAGASARTTALLTLVSLISPLSRPVRCCWARTPREPSACTHAELRFELSRRHAHAVGVQPVDAHQGEGRLEPDAAWNQQRGRLGSHDAGDVEEVEEADDEHQ